MTRNLSKGVRLVQTGLIALIAAACGSSQRTPTAAATPQPTPTPALTSAPQGSSCFLPALKDLHNDCPKVDSKLLDHVTTAIDAVIQKQPELFDFNDMRGGSPKVLDRQKYQTAVVAAINAQGGVCAKDDNEEVAVKISNDYNEQFNVWTSSGYTRRSYITTCFPAQF